MQLHPRESFTIVRQIEDHTDSATYYVRAVIRNAKTDAIIQVNGNNFLNLDDNGSRRFSKSWLVPADPSGQGFWITILISTYTDSAYTTKSQNYADKMETYLIQERFNQNNNQFVGGPDIDYNKIRQIIAEEAKKAAKDIDFPEQTVPEKLPDVQKMLLVITKAIIAKVEGIKIPEPTKISPALQRLEDLSRQIGSSTKENRQQYVESINKVLGELKSVARMADSMKDLSRSIAEFPKMIEALQKKLETFKLEVPEIGLSLKSPKFGMDEKKSTVSPYEPRVSNLLRK